MKTLLKTVGIMAGLALTTGVVQANEIQYLINNVNDAELMVTSSDTFSAGLYTYSYDVTYFSGPNVGIDGFTVDIPNANSLGLTVANTTGFTLGDPNGIVAGDEVNWTSTQDQSLAGGIKFSFTSPDAPVLGNSGALDGGGYTVVTPNGGNVYVPAVTTPDGGLTAILLGGTLLGLGAIRRKVSSRL